MTKKQNIFYVIIIMQAWVRSLGQDHCKIVFLQKQPPRGVPRKRCSENMLQIYRRTPMSKCDFKLCMFHYKPCLQNLVYKDNMHDILYSHTGKHK